MIFEHGLRFLINKTSTLVTVDVVNVHTFVQTFYLQGACDWKNESIHTGESEAKVESYVMSEVRTYHQKYPEKLKEEVSESSEDQGNFHGN